MVPHLTHSFFYLIFHVCTKTLTVHHKTPKDYFETETDNQLQMMEAGVC